MQNKFLVISLFSAAMNRTEGEVWWVRPLAGALASQTADFCTYPIDTSKTRLQLSGELGGRESYKGMTHAISKVYATEGPSGLYKGFSAALLRQGFYRATVFALYEPLRDFIGPSSFLARVVSGGIGGALGIMCVNPFDVIKVRMQADRTGGRYSSLRAASLHLVREEGLTGMFRGVIPNAQRAFLVNAAELAIYDTLKHWAVGKIGEGIPAYFFASIGAGLVAAGVSTPVDLVKTRVMNQQVDPVTKRGLQYSGSIDCAVKSFKAEGLKGMYKGFLPTWVRLGPYNLIAFLAFEQYRGSIRSASSTKTTSD